MVALMEQKEINEIAIAVKEMIMPEMRAEFMTRAETRLTIREEINQALGVFAESIDEKFKLILEVIGVMQKTLDEHSRMFVIMNEKLDRKADVDEVDGIDRRVTTLERKCKPFFK